MNIAVLLSAPAVRKLPRYDNSNRVRRFNVTKPMKNLSLQFVSKRLHIPRKTRIHTVLAICASTSLLVLFSTTFLRAADDFGKSALAAALAKEDIAIVRAAVADSLRALGEKAGVPEVADKYPPVPKDARWLTAAEVQPGFSKYFDKLEKMRWWRIGTDPTKLTQPLRAPASVLAGNVAAARAQLDGGERSIVVATEAAEFLMWAQEQAGTGLYPFPAARGKTDDKAMAVADAFLAKAEQAGKLGNIVHHGWAIEDGDGGGLQFDNAECGVAMFELYEFTHDDRVLASARKAADWAAVRPLVSNWNYNSFSVWLLAKAHAVTGDAAYLAAAKKKALLGVIPGQLTEGPHAGRWLDPHNARPAYHYIMLRALAQLAAVLPKDDTDRTAIVQSLKLGLAARNQEILTQGVMTKDKAMETLLLLSEVFASDPNFLRESKTSAALDTLGRFVSAEALHGKQFPLGPREWGMFLAHVKARKL